MEIDTGRPRPRPSSWIRGATAVIGGVGASAWASMLSVSASSADSGSAMTGAGKSWEAMSLGRPSPSSATMQLYDPLLIVEAMTMATVVPAPQSGTVTDVYVAEGDKVAVEARSEGLAYTAGVMLACVALGGSMLALRAAGQQVGWAFQLQEPWVVVSLLALAAAITANFAGVFELPSIPITRSGEPASAFATGLLAASRGGAPADA